MMYQPEVFQSGYCKNFPVVSRGAERGGTERGSVQEEAQQIPPVRPVVLPGLEKWASDLPRPVW